MTVLVTAASRHQATAEMAAAIATSLREAGIDAEVKSPADVTTLEQYSAVVLGSAVYAGRWLPDATKFVERFRDELARRPLWMFSSGPIGSPEAKPEGEPPGIAELAWELRAREHRVFSGRIDRSRLGLGERAILRVVRAPEGDYRDWNAVEAWAAKISTELRPAAVVG